MDAYVETPYTYPVRLLCMAGVAGAAGGSLWLWERIQGDLEHPHPVEFMILAALAWLALYLLWQLLVLSTVRYRLEHDRLILRQGVSRLVIPLDGRVRLHRWRWGWAWSGGSQRDLGVEELALFPPLWIDRTSSTWVVAFPGANGGPRAVAFQPTPELLSRLKAKLREHEGVAI